MKTQEQYKDNAFCVLATDMMAEVVYNWLDYYEPDILNSISSSGNLIHGNSMCFPALFSVENIFGNKATVTMECRFKHGSYYTFKSLINITDLNESQENFFNEYA